MALDSSRNLLVQGRTRAHSDDGAVKTTAVGTKSNGETNRTSEADSNSHMQKHKWLPQNTLHSKCGLQQAICKRGERVCEIIFPQQGEDLQRARSSNSRPPAEWVLLPIAVPTRSTPRRRAAGRACRFPIASAAAPQPQPSLLTPPLPGLGPFQGRLRRPRS
jgi:hypothetical protein